MKPYVTALMALATYTVAKCPCKPLISCHKKQFYGSIFLALLLLQLEQNV